MFCIKIAAAVLILMSALEFIFAEGIISIFRDDTNVISIGTTALRCQCCTMLLSSVVVMTNMLYQNIGRVYGAVALAVARQGLFFIPFVLILPKLLENHIWGVYLAQPFADVCSFILAVILGIKMYRELGKKEKKL